MRGRRALRLLAYAAVAALVLALIVRHLTPSGAGSSPSSSYSRAADGLAAYAQLLAADGHPVSRLRRSPGTAVLDPRTTLVLLDPGLIVPADIRALRAFVASGGRLLAGGREPGAWLSELLVDGPDWMGTGASASDFAPLVPSPQSAGVSDVQSAGEGVWSDAHGALPLLGATGARDATLLALSRIGSGEVELLADASPLQQAHLAQADNAALGLGLAGPPGRPVVFEEAVHGYGSARGLGALPSDWKWALGGLALAAVALVASRFRRLGPAAPAGRPVPPARLAHVEALALALSRTRDRETVVDAVAHRLGGER